MTPLPMPRSANVHMTGKKQKKRNRVADICNSAKKEYTLNNLQDNKHNPKNTLE